MNLLLLTQRVDDHDANLAFHVRWIAQMARRTERITVIAQAVGEHALPSNVQVYSLGKERGASKLRQGLTLLRLLWREVRRHDAIFVLMIPLYVLASVPFALVWQKPRFMWYAHGSVSFSLRLATFFCTTVFTSSAGGFRLETPKRRIVGQAIDTEVFSPDASVSRVSTRLLTVGRISPVKHVDVLIDALHRLRGDGTPYELHVIGEPIVERDLQYVEALKEQVRRLCLEGAVHFRGARAPSDLPDEYRRAAVCLNASTTGSLDKAVLEAMACACPVVSGNEAYRSVLPTGAFVAVRTADAYAEAIRSVLGRTEGAWASREIVVRDHDRTRTIARIMNEIICSLSSGRGGDPKKDLFGSH